MEQYYLKDVATLSLDNEKCVGCKMCSIVCPHRVFEMNNNKAYIIDKNRCMECGACELNCPAKAISVDVNVGCASAIIKGWLTGTEPSCDCTDSDCC